MSGTMGGVRRGLVWMNGGASNLAQLRRNRGEPGSENLVCKGDDSHDP
jgi:hypothetical protein